MPSFNAAMPPPTERRKTPHPQGRRQGHQEPCSSLATYKRVVHMDDIKATALWQRHPNQAWLASVAPDPWDTFLKKREWEEQMQHWKAMMRRTAGRHSS